MLGACLGSNINHDPETLRACVIRGYWDGQTHPSIECPVSDFMGMAHGKVMAYQSAVHSVGPSAGMNFWLPMPFTKRARFTFTHEGSQATPLFYQKGLFERQDDWSCATFWYEPVPSAPLPAFPGVKARTANLWMEPAK